MLLKCPYESLPVGEAMYPENKEQTSENVSGRYENIKGKGNRFTTDNQPAKRGRKPSLYRQIKELLGTDARAELSREDYYRLIRFLLEQPLDTLKRLADYPTTPIWVINLIRAVVKDSRAGRMDSLNSLLDRLFGKAAQPLAGEDGERLFPPHMTVVVDADTTSIIQSIGRRTQPKPNDDDA